MSYDAGVFDEPRVQLQRTISCVGYVQSRIRNKHMHACPEHKRWALHYARAINRTLT